MRLAAMKDVANEIRANADRTTRDEYREQLAAFDRILHQRVSTLDEKKSSPVAQTNFNTGDVELF